MSVKQPRSAVLFVGEAGPGSDIPLYTVPAGHTVLVKNCFSWDIGAAGGLLMYEGQSSRTGLTVIFSKDTVPAGQLIHKEFGVVLDDNSVFLVSVPSSHMRFWIDGSLFLGTANS